AASAAKAAAADPRSAGPAAPPASPCARDPGPAAVAGCSGPVGGSSGGPAVAGGLLGGPALLADAGLAAVDLVGGPDEAALRGGTFQALIADNRVAARASRSAPFRPLKTSSKSPLPGSSDRYLLAALVGAIVGALALWLVRARSAPPLAVPAGPDAPDDAAARPPAPIT
ncbi:MAG TPA: hypothetical protein VHL53_05710, partial [Acidimicrobiia bacterium]|nr:hypothetical protein [Acidimicrobiia bacterium]